MILKMSSVETLSNPGQTNSSLIIQNNFLLASLVMLIVLLLAGIDSANSLNEGVQRIRENVLAVL